MTAAPSLRVLFRDARWLAVDKPPGLPTTPSPNARSLVDRVREELAPAAQVWHPLSRLDHDVTGAVLFALDRDATRIADRARELPEGYRRAYLALVQPAPASLEFVWDWDVGVDPRDPHRRLADAGRDRQTAHTTGRVEDRRGAVGRLALRPVTGRTHQLRVHAHRAGCPILGDRTYAGARRVVAADGAVRSVPRVMLHCAHVALDGGPSVHADPPEDFEALWGGLA